MTFHLSKDEKSRARISSLVTTLYVCVEFVECAGHGGRNGNQHARTSGGMSAIDAYCQFVDMFQTKFYIVDK